MTCICIRFCIQYLEFIQSTEISNFHPLELRPVCLWFLSLVPILLSHFMSTGVMSYLTSSRCLLSTFILLGKFRFATVRKYFCGGGSFQVAFWPLAINISCVPNISYVLWWKSWVVLLSDWAKIYFSLFFFCLFVCLSICLFVCSKL